MDEDGVGVVDDVVAAAVIVPVVISVVVRDPIGASAGGRVLIGRFSIAGSTGFSMEGSYGQITFNEGVGTPGQQESFVVVPAPGALALLVLPPGGPFPLEGLPTLFVGLEHAGAAALLVGRAARAPLIRVRAHHRRTCNRRR